MASLARVGDYVRAKYAVGIPTTDGMRQVVKGAVLRVTKVRGSIGLQYMLYGKEGWWHFSHFEILTEEEMGAIRDELERAEDAKRDKKAGKPVNPKQAFGDKKPRLTLLPLSAQLAQQEAHMDGALKYGEQNWRETPVEAMTYIDAAKRHLALFENGELFARDTTVQNLGAVMACCAILIDAMAHDTMIDNRRPSKRACDLLHGRGEQMVAHLKKMQIERMAEVDKAKVHPWVSCCGSFPNLAGYRQVEIKYANGLGTKVFAVDPRRMDFGIDWYGVEAWRRYDG